MSMSDTFESDLLKLIFNNTPAALIGDATGLPGSAVAGSLYLSLHTADPGEAGNQTTSEIAYTSYARVAVARSTSGWTISGTSPTQAALFAAANFPAGTGGSGTATYFGVGASSSGTGKLLGSGTVTPNIVCGNGITPQLTTSSTITLD